MAPTSLNVSELQLVKRIYKRNITLTDTEYLFVWNMCALSDNEMLLAVHNSAPRSIVAHRTMAPYLLTRSRRYSKRLQSGIRHAHRHAALLVKDTNEYKLVTLRRNTGNANEWFQVDHMSTDILFTHSFHPT